MGSDSDKGPVLAQILASLQSISVSYGVTLMGGSRVCESGAAEGSGVTAEFFYTESESFSCSNLPLNVFGLSSKPY